MLGVENKSVSLRWEMNSILMQILPQNFFCIDHQHGRLDTWLQTKIKLIDQLVRKSIGLYRSVDRSIDRTINRSIDQPINQTNKSLTLEACI